MIEANLTWAIKCADCPAEIRETFSTDWFSGWTCGKLTEEDLSGENAIDNARASGWRFERATYEELKPFCPNCKNNA